jgi:hypothetical protein
MKLGWWLPLNLAGALILGLALVWLSIERVELAYSLKRLSTEHAELTALVDKLKTERNNLVSPHSLRRMAQELDLKPAQSGQLRRISTGSGQGGGS